MAASLYVSESVSDDMIWLIPLAIATGVLTLQNTLTLLKPVGIIKDYQTSLRRESCFVSQEEIKGKQEQRKGSEKTSVDINGDDEEEKKPMRSSKGSNRSPTLSMNEGNGNPHVNIILKNLMKGSFAVMILGGGVTWISFYFGKNDNTLQATIMSLLATSSIKLASTLIFKGVTSCNAETAHENYRQLNYNS